MPRPTPIRRYGLPSAARPHLGLAKGAAKPTPTATASNRPCPRCGSGQGTNALSARPQRVRSHGVSSTVHLAAVRPSPQAIRVANRAKNEARQLTRPRTVPGLSSVLTRCCPRITHVHILCMASSPPRPIPTSRQVAGTFCPRLFHPSPSTAPALAWWLQGHGRR